MNTEEKNIYGEQHKLMRESLIPFAVFEYSGSGVDTVVVSDGLCEMYGKTRDKLIEHFNKDIFQNVNYEDAEKTAKLTELFSGKTDVCSVCYRERINGEIRLMNIHAKASVVDGKRLCTVNFNDITDNVSAFVGTAFTEFQGGNNILDNFIKGMDNDSPFDDFESQYYSVWNLSTGKCIYVSDSDYAVCKLGKDIDYDLYFQMYYNHLDYDEDRECFEALTPENLKRSFLEQRTLSEFSIKVGAYAGRFYLKVIPSLMFSSHDNSLYLKLQFRNITQDVLFDNMINATASEIIDFAAYVNQKGNVYYLDTDQEQETDRKYCNGKLSDLVELFSSKLGYNFENALAIKEFIKTKCGEKEVSFTNKLSDRRVIRINIKKINDNKHYYFVSCKDITEMLGMESASYYDDLTGLPNMMHFRNSAITVCGEMKSKGIVPAFVYFDLRDMKAVNENYGFAKGNGILTGTSYVLCSVFKGDTVSRFADDHFVVLTDRNHLEEKLEKVYDEVLNNPSGIPIQICAGIYVYEGRQKLDIIAACDRARLACKSLKGDYNHKYKFFDRAMFDGYHQRQHILTHFNEALEKGWIKLYYQPIIRTITGNVCDMEALSRWIDPERGMLAPSQFIPVLEEHQLISKLDFYMVRKICENLKEQQKRNLPVVPVSVNLSRVDFEQCDVVDSILEIVDEYGVSHSMITIEITESAVVNNQQFLNKQIDRFREAGFEVWMDDFGSEYSSLNTLQEFDFDLIKLDMKFMKNFSLTGKNHAILSDVVGMVSRLGIHTLAEGVQTEEQLKFLSDIGCEKAQGYLFSRPMPCEYFIERSARPDEKLKYDDLDHSSYYNKIGSVNFKDSILMEMDDNISNIISGIPAAVIEYRDDQYKILKANDAYKKYLVMTGVLTEPLEDKNYLQLDIEPTDKFKQTVLRCFHSKRWESIADDEEGNVSVSSRLLCITYDKKTNVGAVMVIINRTYWTDEEKLYAENEYHFNTNLLWMAGKGLAGLLGYRSIYDFLSVSCYLHVNLTKNMIEEVHLSKDDVKRMGADYFKTYDDFVVAEMSSQPESVITQEQIDYYDRKTLIRRFLEEESSADIEFRRVYDREYRWKHMICRMNNVNDEIHAWFFMYDINDFIVHNQAMQRRAENDGLTGLLNQTTAIDSITEYLKNANDESCALIMVDINNFKSYNDKYGHGYGDNIIRQFAKILNEEFSDDCILGRVGGDEFIILVKHCDEQRVKEITEELKNKEYLSVCDGIKENFTVSLGYAMYPTQEKQFHELYRRADIAMYSSKPKNN